MKFQFSSLAEFIEMGGHGLFVWSAFIIVILGLAVLMWLPVSSKKEFIKVQKGILERESESNS